MVVPVTTGLPAGSEYVPEPFLLKVDSLKIKTRAEAGYMDVETLMKVIAGSLGAALYGLIFGLIPRYKRPTDAGATEEERTGKKLPTRLIKR